MLCWLRKMAKAMEPAERLDFGGTFRGQRLLRNPLYPRRSTSCAERTNGASQNEGRSELGGYTMEAMVPPLLEPLADIWRWLRPAPACRRRACCCCCR